MDEQIIFTTNNTGTVCNVHSLEQTSLRQCLVGSRNSAVQVGNKYLFVAQAQKALINVYDISGKQKRESVEQRLPLPEVVSCLAVVENNVVPSPESQKMHHRLPEFNLPYLLLASTPSGKLYMWELNSGLLLGVKMMAHYQSITKIQPILNGNYVVTSGNDSRVIIWQTVDLVCEEEPRNVCVIHDHTLAVTDFCVSATCGDFGTSYGAKLFTASQDATLRCYELNLSATNTKNDLVQPKLLATFTCPYPILSLALDPADRACYIGTQKGVLGLQLYYKLGSAKVANLVQSAGNNGKLFSLVVEDEGERDKLYAQGQLVCSKVVDSDATCIQVSLDGSLLILGGSEGGVSIVEAYSKQILRTVQPLTTVASNGAVTNILLSTYSQETNANFASLHKSTPHKIPPLQRIVYDKKGLHEIWFQVGEEKDTAPLQDFDAYLANVQKEQMLWSQSQKDGAVGSIASPGLAKTLPIIPDDAKDKEIAELKGNISTLKDAYKELRAMHEKLFQEHEELLEKSQ